MTTLTEQELIDLLLKKDKDAFRNLVEGYQNVVFNTSLNFLAIKEDAEEITQDVFLEVYKSIESFRSDASLKTWIYRITISKCLEFQRKMKRKKRFAFFVSIGGTIDTKDEPEVLDHPGVSSENEERTKVLYKHISLLSENQKIAFTLHNMDGLTYKEIAETMQVSVSSVESLIFRGKQNLKKSLSKYYQLIQ